VGLGDEEPPILKTDLPIGPTMSATEQVFAMRVFDLVNVERLRAGLEPLEWSQEAADVAYEHCVDMHLRNYYGHYTPEGTSPCDRMRATGLPMVICGGENIARGNSTPEDVMAVWMNSPPHRANILEPLYTHVGVAVHGGKNGPWWTQDFFRPLNTD
jgi:uncharacterized protein YkwD